VVESEHAATLVERPTYTRDVIRRLVPLAVLLTAALAPSTARAQEGFEREVEGFGFAVNLAFAQDGTMFVADKDVGEIRIVRDGEILDAPFATLPVQVTVNETGLLGVAVDPAFPDEPWVYAYYTGRDVVNHLVRIRADGDRGTEIQPLLDLLPATAGWHNGGDIAFGPDGKLYVSVGDGHDGSRSQDPNGIGGRILRLNPDGSIPDDNPLGPGNPTFALGIRNSFGLCFDPETGDLWETENGPSGDDEINLIEPGANYGWPEQLGPGGEPDFVDPVLDFRDTIVPTGCAVSDGVLFFGEGYGGNLHAMPLPGPGEGSIARFDGGIIDLERAAGGSLLVVTPTALYRSTGALERPSATVSPEPEPPSAPLTVGGLLIAGVLIGGLLLMRSRLLRH
jgi:glucose/arabinose dehydrogenase